MNASSKNRPQGAKIRVILADDHAVLRKGLKALLAEHGGIEVVGEAENGAEAAELAARLKPDVTVMDLMMPVMDGLGATEEIVRRDPGAKVMLLTTFGEAEAVRTALKSGARGAATKDIDFDELVAAIRTVAAGGTFVSPSLGDFVEEDTGIDSLTLRQREILADIANGLSNRAISEKYGIAVSTVKEHVRQIFEKIDVGNRAEAAALAIRRKCV